MHNPARGQVIAGLAGTHAVAAMHEAGRCAGDAARYALPYRAVGSPDAASRGEATDAGCRRGVAAAAGRAAAGRAAVGRVVR